MFISPVNAMTVPTIPIKQLSADKAPPAAETNPKSSTQDQRDLQRAQSYLDGLRDPDNNPRSRYLTMVVGPGMRQMVAKELGSRGYAKGELTIPIDLKGPRDPEKRLAIQFEHETPFALRRLAMQMIDFQLKGALQNGELGYGMETRGRIAPELDIVAAQMVGRLYAEAVANGATGLDELHTPQGLKVVLNGVMRKLKEGGADSSDSLNHPNPPTWNQRNSMSWIVSTTPEVGTSLNEIESRVQDSFIVGYAIEQLSQYVQAARQYREQGGEDSGAPPPQFPRNLSQLIRQMSGKARSAFIGALGRERYAEGLRQSLGDDALDPHFNRISATSESILSKDPVVFKELKEALSPVRGEQMPDEVVDVLRGYISSEAHLFVLMDYVRAKKGLNYIPTSEDIWRTGRLLNQPEIQEASSIARAITAYELIRTILNPERSPDAILNMIGENESITPRELLQLHNQIVQAWITDKGTRSSRNPVMQDLVSYLLIKHPNHTLTRVLKGQLDTTGAEKGMRLVFQSSSRGQDNAIFSYTLKPSRSIPNTP